MLNLSHIPSRRSVGGFTVIELLVAVMLGVWTSVATVAILDVLKAHEQIERQAESNRLGDLSVSARDNSRDANATVEDLRESAQAAQDTGDEIPHKQLELFRDDLRLNRERVEWDLRALQDLYPELSRHDRLLARKLRQPLQTLHVELERTALLTEMLLVTPLE